MISLRGVLYVSLFYRSTMSKPVIFRSSTARYRADTCNPLVEAAARGEVRLSALGHAPYPGIRLDHRTLRQIRSAGYWNADRGQNWGLDWHRNEGIEFTYLQRGRLDFGVDDEAFTLLPGCMTITRPWQRHRVGAPNVDASHLIWLIVDVGVRRPNQTWKWPSWLVLTPEETQRLTQLLSHNEQPVWMVNTAVANCFQRMAQIVDQSHRRFDRTRMVVCINELLMEILNLFNSKNVPLEASLTGTTRNVALFLQELKHEYAEPWTLDTMAEQVGLKRSRFTSYCRQLTNMTPMEYLTHARIDAAKRLLREHPNVTITRVAMACGFNSSQYFATTFRKIVGLTPREYRQDLPASMEAVGMSVSRPCSQQLI